MKTRAKVGQQSSNPAYRTSSVFLAKQKFKIDNQKIGIKKTAPYGELAGKER